MTLDEKRKRIGKWLQEEDGGALWDLMTALRGPDTPSERADMSADERSVAYAGRRKRKFKTVEVIRSKAFFGVVGGSARSHQADYITLPPKSEWDHFDRHCERAALLLGLDIRIEEKETEPKGIPVEPPPVFLSKIQVPHYKAKLNYHGIPNKPPKVDKMVVSPPGSTATVLVWNLPEEVWEVFDVADLSGDEVDGSQPVAQPKPKMAKTLGNLPAHTDLAQAHVKTSAKKFQATYESLMQDGTNASPIYTNLKEEKEEMEDDEVPF